MSMTKLIVGNWKMNGLMASLAQATAVAEGLEGADSSALTVVICPPATLIAAAKLALTGTRVGVGAQDCHARVSGAHTGDISAQMLGDAGATYVIVGHSERRTDHQEANSVVQAKAAAAIQAGLLAIICVGESEAQRDAGQAQDIVLGQLLGSIPESATARQVIIAYEPVWAIGTGRTPTIEDVGAMHGAIRDALVLKFGENDGQSIAILYGGSVNPGNAGQLLNIANVNGALVGGASLTAVNFLGIIQTQL